MIGKLGMGLLLVAVAACAPTVPPSSSPSVPASPTPASTSPGPTATPSVPFALVCDPTPASLGTTDAGSPIPVHLTCQAAIAATSIAVSAQISESAITGMAFHFRRWCPPGVFCAFSNDDDGYVVVHTIGAADLLVQVSADASGHVRVEYAGPFPSTDP